MSAQWVAGRPNSLDGQPHFVVFMLCAHVPLASLMVRLEFHALGPLP
jgi:hypothetical protein